MENPNFAKKRIFRLPPGFRFHPTDDELVEHYLKRKVLSLPLPVPIPEADVCKFDPWSLPGDLEQERYFFSSMEIKYPNEKLSNRATKSGFWKSSGLEKQIVDSRNNQVVGTKKTLVFYVGKPPKGSKTDWIIHEYKLSNPTQGMEKWAICRMFMKKRARKVGRNSNEYICGPKGMYDLNLDSSSSCSSGVTIADEEGEESSRQSRK